MTNLSVVDNTTLRKSPPPRYRIIKVDPTDPIAVSKAKAEIADRYAELNRRRPSSGIHWMAAKRIHELDRYLAHRYGRFVRTMTPAARTS